VYGLPAGPAARRNTQVTDLLGRRTGQGAVAIVMSDTVLGKDPSERRRQAAARVPVTLVRVGGIRLLAALFGDMT
jgi:hypothetical protein